MIAQSIAQSKKPIVTGIGHESDETLADRAADIQAITPTAAAVLLAHHQSEVIATPNSTALPLWLWAAVLAGILTIIALLLVVFVRA